MPRKPKIPSEEKIWAVEAYIDGKLGYNGARRKYEIQRFVWRSWVYDFK